jgi:hypothetical protein
MEAGGWRFDVVDLGGRRIEGDCHAKPCGEYRGRSFCPSISRLTTGRAAQRRESTTRGATPPSQT